MRKDKAAFQLTYLSSLLINHLIMSCQHIELLTIHCYNPTILFEGMLLIQFWKREASCWTITSYKFLIVQIPHKKSGTCRFHNIILQASQNPSAPRTQTQYVEVLWTESVHVLPFSFSFSITDPAQRLNADNRRLTQTIKFHVALRQGW